MIARLLGVSKRFAFGGEMVQAVDAVDLEVSAGEFTCIYGASGSGKTTLLHLMAGIEVPDAGQIHVGTQQLAALDEEERADVRLREIGVVFQTNNLLPELTVRENVTLPLLVRGLARHAANAAADDALTSVGLLGLGDRLPERMSGGQRQRAGIARALAGRQSLLLADEPTGALDSDSSRRLFSLLRELCKERSTAVVLATHDPLAREFADSTYLMVDGRLGPR